MSAFGAPGRGRGPRRHPIGVTRSPCTIPTVEFSEPRSQLLSEVTTSVSSRAIRSESRERWRPGDANAPSRSGFASFPDGDINRAGGAWGRAGWSRAGRRHRRNGRPTAGGDHRQPDDLFLQLPVDVSGVVSDLATPRSPLAPRPTTTIGHSVSWGWRTCITNGWRPDWKGMTSDVAAQLRQVAVESIGPTETGYLRPWMSAAGQPPILQGVPTRSVPRGRRVEDRRAA